MLMFGQPRPETSNLLVSLDHTGRRVVLGPTLNTQTLMKTDEQKKGPCIIFMISATADKQKSPHMITPIMQRPFR